MPKRELKFARSVPGCPVESGFRRIGITTSRWFSISYICGEQHVVSQGLLRKHILTVGLVPVPACSHGYLFGRVQKVFLGLSFRTPFRCVWIIQWRFPVFQVFQIADTWEFCIIWQDKESSRTASYILTLPVAVLPIPRPDQGGSSGALTWKRYHARLGKAIPNQQNPLGAGWWFQIFLIFTPNFGEDSQFDEHIFQRGWNCLEGGEDLFEFVLKCILTQPMANRLTLKLLRIAYLIGKIKLKLLFHVPLAE